jgi:hypothetical protein
MAVGTTVIVNDTAHALDMKVGNPRYFVHYATVDRGAKYTMQMDDNATYQEFLMGVDTKGQQLIVSSDEFCDYKCIVIKEVDGEFNVEKEPRWQFSDEATMETPTAVKKSKLSWRFWL